MEARVARRGLLLALAVVLLIRLPFLNQAVQGDDDIYLTEGEHALIDPLHPQDTNYVFQGDEVDLRGHPHPPGNGWVLAGLIAALGDVREAPFHAAYIVFSLVAAAAMWRLARRFSPHPVWATLLFLAVPAFVVNGNSLEADLPFLAFWMASVALFTWEKPAALPLAAMALALAALTAYQAILLTPILAVYVWLYRRRDRAAWLILFVPPLTIALWQGFEWVTTGTLPAAVLFGYFHSYDLQSGAAKLRSAFALAIQSCFLVFPALLPAAAVRAWRKRREPDTLFPLAWIALFFAGSAAIFFAGAARYLLPMAAPVALLASSLRPRWLAPAFAAQLALGLGLAIVNYQHWDGYRKAAQDLRGPAAGHRVWIDGEWGLRYYLEAGGALPLRKNSHVRTGDFVVSSELGRSVELHAPAVPISKATICPWIPLRLIGLESHSGYSTVSRGLWPFGISSGPIDNIGVRLVRERNPSLAYLPMNAPQAPEQIAAGIYALEANRYRWMSGAAVVVLKAPAEAMPLSVTFAIPEQARARRVVLLLDGREVASHTYDSPGEYTLASPPVRATGAYATVEIRVDRTFSAPGDSRELGVVLNGVGFSAGVS